MAAQILVSWAGLRGAASIVFAIMARSSGTVFEHDIFHMIFFIVLFFDSFAGNTASVCGKAARYD